MMDLLNSLLKCSRQMLSLKAQVQNREFGFLSASL